MTTSCSLSSTRRLALLLGVAGSLAAPIVLTAGPGMPGLIAAVAGTLLCLAIAGAMWLRLRALEHILTGALAICDKAAAGDFDHRILGISETGIIGLLLHRVNDVVDLADCFIREAAAAMAGAADKRYFRKVTVRGLKGAYRGVAESINRSLDNMDSEDTQLSRLHDELEELISAAARGDLAQRIAPTGGNEAMARLCLAINSLVETTATAVSVIDTVLSAIAAGDLDSRVTAELEGVFDAMRTSTNTMADQLSDIVGNIHVALANINVMTGEVAMGSRDLSASTDEQADLLSHTVNTMAQINLKLEKNTGAAEEGSRLVSDARALATRAGGTADSAVAAIRRIAESSRKVSEVVAAIDEIAFQTNILALNASVEAARVGEAGRGFAVVAGEVRQLARRAAESNREIKDMLAESAREIATGVELVLAAGDALAEIVQAISTVGTSTDVIVTASREQSASLSDISEAINRMEEMTRHNAALAQHSADAALAVENHVMELGNLLTHFRTSAN
ncbi:MAG: methyl-accepting chemotaxis protein [Rhodospirillaceae bacterium]